MTAADECFNHHFGDGLKWGLHFVMILHWSFGDSLMLIQGLYGASLGTRLLRRLGGLSQK